MLCFIIKREFLLGRSLFGFAVSCLFEESNHVLQMAEIIDGFPCRFLGTVALPLNQIFISASSKTFVEDAFDLIELGLLSARHQSNSVNSRTIFIIASLPYPA